ncbi:MAG: polysaccharide biosynthesis tyrosine autokinase [candidate division WOR-3 bacterium]
MPERVIEEEGKELKTYFFLLLENKVLFLTTFFIVIALVFLITKITKPTYQSTSLILIETSDKGLSFLPIRDLNPRQTVINNHIEMVQSRTLFERVENVIANSGYLDSLYIGKFKEKEARISYLKKNLTVIPVKDTDILKIIYNDKSPQDAFYITKIIVEQYYNINLEMTRGELSEVRKFLEEQLTKIENDLQTNEEGLKKFKESNSIIELTEETSKLVDMISNFEGQKKQNYVEREMLLAKLNYLKENLSQSNKMIAEGFLNELDPFLERSMKELDSLQSSYAYFLSLGYDTSHPKMREIKIRVENLKSNIVVNSKKSITEKYFTTNPLDYSKNLMDEIVSVQLEIKVKESMIEALNNVIKIFEEKMKMIPYQELMLARLERNKKVSEELYLMLKGKFEEAKVAEAGKLGSVKIIDKPVLNRNPVLPKKNRNYLFGFFLAIILGIGSVFLKEYIDDSVKDIDEIERELKVNIIGNIPLIKLKNGKSMISERGKLLTEVPENSPIVESYKILRTNLLYLSEGTQTPKIIVVSSATKGEGKSTTASNLSIVLAQLDKKVLLIDGDLRRPVIDKLFNLSFDKGFTNILKGETSVEKVIYPSGIENLWIIPYGERTTHSTELLEGKLTRKIFEQLRNMFDFIIVDSSPILSVADPTIISRLSDGLLWVVQFKKAKKRELHYTKKLLKNLNIPLVGFVFNNINTESFYGKYYYYHYYYHYHTKEGEK